VLNCCDILAFTMLKRRRGVVVKCAGLIVAFWSGFAFYAAMVSRSNDYGRPAPSTRRSVGQNAAAEAGQHMPMPLPLTARPHGWAAEQEDDRVRRDRELQERFRHDQTKLRELLDGKRTPVAAASPARAAEQYDPQTASLIRLGLIVPKWNLTQEVAEHYGAPGKWICAAVCGLIYCKHIIVVVIYICSC